MGGAAYGRMHPALVAEIGNYRGGSINIINNITIKSQSIQLIIATVRLQIK